MADQEQQRASIMAMLVAAEATYGVAPAFDPALHGLLANSGVTWEPKMDTVERKILKPTFSPAGVRVVSASQTLRVEVEARGGGLDVSGAPKAPDWEPLALACGLQKTACHRLTVGDATGYEIGETITGATSGATATLHHIDGDVLVVTGVTGSWTPTAENVTGSESAAASPLTGVVQAIEYRPVTANSAAQKSCAIRFHKDAILHQLVGARGNMNLSAKNKEIPSIQFDFSGLWVDPADANLPTPTLTDLKPPVFLNAGARIGEYIPVFDAFSLNLNNKVEARPSANAADGMAGFLITGRRPSGSMNPEADSLANRPIWATLRSGATADYSCNIGSEAGNRLRVQVPAAQLEGVKYSERVNIVCYDESFVCKEHRVGDDECRLYVF